MANKGKSRIIPTGDVLVGLVDVDDSMQCSQPMQVIQVIRMKSNKLQCKVT